MQMRPMSENTKNQIYQYTLLQEENIFSHFSEGPHSLQKHVDSIDKKFYTKFDQKISEQDHRENYYED